MKVGNRTIDHIVYAVFDLEKAMLEFEAKTGVQPKFGGYHPTQGTENALVHLGGRCYLEFLAIDASNPNINPPRWMGIDYIDKPQITRWAIDSKNLEKDCETLKTYNAEMGNIQKGQRAKMDGSLLKWQLTMPLSSPKVEVVPFAIDWQYSESHPTDSLSPQCQLLDLKITTPNGKEVLDIFSQLNITTIIEQGLKNSIVATIKTPQGIIQI